MLLVLLVVFRGSSAVSLGFVIFILGWIIQSVVAFGYPFTPGATGKDGVGQLPSPASVHSDHAWQGGSFAGHSELLGLA